MKRHLSAAEILLNIIRGGIIIAIVVTIVCFYVDNSNTSTIVIEGMDHSALASAAPLASETESRQPDSSSAAEALATRDSLTSENRSDSAGLININTATAEQLTTLNGIGEVKAAAIIEYRQQHGKFTSADDLLNVSGIGEKTLESIRNRITV